MRNDLQSKFDTHMDTWAYLTALLSRMHFFDTYCSYIVRATYANFSFSSTRSGRDYKSHDCFIRVYEIFLKSASVEILPYHSSTYDRWLAFGKI